MIEALGRDPAAANNSSDTVKFATSAVLKGGQAASIDRVLTLAAADNAPDWARTAVLAGVRYFLPKSAEGKEFAASLPAEPKPLLALAARQDTPFGAAAQQLLGSLKWPGKAGSVMAVMKPLSAAEQELFEKGKTQFATLCAACHQPNGQGLPGLAPSLVYSRWVLGDPRILSRIVLNGKTQQNLIMPPWKAMLDDTAIAGVLTFVRRSWGHDADPVSLATVVAARRDTAKRDEPWTDTDLEELVQTLSAAAH